MADTGFHSEPSSVFHYLPKEGTSLVDMGCNVGSALEEASQLGFRRLRGIELNPEAVETARKRLAYLLDCQIFQGSIDTLPLADGTMDVALCSEVLEHLPEGLRPKVVQEAFRVLRDEGAFIITVPYNGVFAWMDPANIRFRFPRAYRALSKLMGGGGRDPGYEGQKHGVVWHHHFDLSELNDLLKPYFSIQTLRYRGSWITPLVDWFLFPFYRAQAFQNSIFKWMKKIQDEDMKFQSSPRHSYNVLMVLKKKSKGLDRH